MNDKEYTYDIDKYTIGVDTNGEDGIGMTVAKIENGEINFLGNCYGENARCLDLLIKENQELKKQLEKRTKMYQNAYDYSQEMEGKAIVLETQQKDLKKQVEDLFSENRNLRKKLENCMTFEDYKYTLNKKIKLEIQQKEFIKHLEDKIYSIEPKGTDINYNCEYDSEEDYVMAMQEQSRLNTLKEILQKYKEIIGVSDESR